MSLEQDDHEVLRGGRALQKDDKELRKGMRRSRVEDRNVSWALYLTTPPLP